MGNKNSRPQETEIARPDEGETTFDPIFEESTTDDPNIEDQLPNIPTTTYECKEISVNAIYTILNGSRCLKHKSDLQSVLDTVPLVEREPSWKRRDCEISIYLTGDHHNDVQLIVIKAGKGDFKINCTKNSTGEVSWNQWTNHQGQEIPTENYQCEIITDSEINKILNKSKLIETTPHRRFIASDVRNNVNKEFLFILRNCSLTIHLDDDEKTGGICVKEIKIRAGKGENEIKCSTSEPWVFVKRTKKTAFLHILRTVYESIRNTVPRLLSGILGGASKLLLP